MKKLLLLCMIAMASCRPYKPYSNPFQDVTHEVKETYELFLIAKNFGEPLHATLGFGAFELLFKWQQAIIQAYKQGEVSKSHATGMLIHCNDFFLKLSLHTHASWLQYTAWHSNERLLKGTPLAIELLLEKADNEPKTDQKIIILEKANDTIDDFDGHKRERDYYLAQVNVLLYFLYMKTGKPTMADQAMKRAHQWRVDGANRVDDAYMRRWRHHLLDINRYKAVQQPLLTYVTRTKRRETWGNLSDQEKLDDMKFRSRYYEDKLVLNFTRFGRPIFNRKYYQETLKYALPERMP